MFKAMLIKEYLLVFRDKHALAALFVMPAVFILIMSLALKDTFNEERSVLSMAIADQAANDSSRLFVDSIQGNKQLNSKLLVSDDTHDVEQQGVQFVIVLPDGYGVEQDKKLQIQVASDVSQAVLLLFKAQVMQIIMQQKMDSLHARQVERASQAGSPIPEANSLSEKDLMNIQYVRLDEDVKPTSTQQSVPSWIVFGLFFVVIPMSTIFISERKQNTLMRLTVMNVTIPALFAGKIIPYMIINQLQVWLMIAVGMYVVPMFGADALTLGGSLPGLILLSLALSLAAIGLSILIATVVDSVEQATTIGGIINILLGAIGGVMVPKYIMPEFMQNFANISPMSWGLDGYLDLFLRNGSLADVANEILALTSFGLLLLLLAAIIFNIKIRTVS
ncbi:ABC transporter permease [Granulosicoccus antarcticus]|uniref:Inner membrane transport permease YbhR n=1 Tax=Granulosicoccus antarcticus IMCC3135 TaxID=1192854 RepID=A0A2Z2NYC5_9GAMM|nr:ABC transporter permease [Granulosicoccus antarcticus]ASJ72767.1 Inner membrane transport permease YbhR [Granulosicoccus antarcticus IMCC3135]